MLTSFSIVICTYNGANRLGKTLEKINNLIVSEFFSFNVIIVDNNSSDNTFNYSKQLKKDYSKRLDLIVLQELTQGKIYAIETALDYSTSDWIVICDDDNWLRNDYLIIAYSLIESFKDVGIFGGVSNLFVNDDVTIPEWFIKNSLIYAVGDQYAKSTYVSYKENLWGAGSILKRESLSKCIKLVEPLILNFRGEDSEIGYRFIILGYKLYFSSKLIFDHCIDFKRIDYEAHCNLLINNIQNDIILIKYQKFLKYFYFNKRKILHILKWNLIYFIFILNSSSIKNLDNFYTMVNIFTNYGTDGDYKLIKNFYKKCKFIFSIIIYVV
jgi:glycosyltransferase involved in cell wall biosynthesis